MYSCIHAVIYACQWIKIASGCARVHHVCGGLYSITVPVCGVSMLTKDHSSRPIAQYAFIRYCSCIIPPRPPNLAAEAEDCVWIDCHPSSLLRQRQWREAGQLFVLQLIPLILIDCYPIINAEPQGSYTVLCTEELSCHRAPSPSLAVCGQLEL